MPQDNQRSAPGDRPGPVDPRPTACHAGPTCCGFILPANEPMTGGQLRVWATRAYIDPLGLDGLGKPGRNLPDGRIEFACTLRTS